MRSHLYACQNCHPVPYSVQHKGLYSFHYSLCLNCKVTSRVVITFDRQFLYEIPKNYTGHWNNYNQ